MTVNLGLTLYGLVQFPATESETKRDNLSLVLLGFFLRAYEDSLLASNAAILAFLQSTLKLCEIHRKTWHLFGDCMTISESNPVSAINELAEQLTMSMQREHIKTALLQFGRKNGISTLFFISLGIILSVNAIDNHIVSDPADGCNNCASLKMAKPNPAYKKATRLLPSIQTVLVVSKEGYPNHFSTVQAAVDAVPMWNNVRWVVYIKPGTYHGPIVIPEGKDYITFLGEGAESTVLSFNRKASQIRADGTELGILDCASAIIQGSYFTARGITFENASPKPDDFDFDAQAPALRISGDACAFYSCNFFGWQDTLFADQGRQYYKDCRIEGSVDFILGYAQAVFDNCTIHSRAEGFISAQSRWCDSGCPGANTAFVFLKCTLTGNGPSYLGRPWRPYAKVLFLDTSMGAHIAAQGWIDWLTNMGPLFLHDNTDFAEFGSTGPGANPAQRVSWSHQLTREEAEPYLNWRTYLEADSWLEPPSTAESISMALVNIHWREAVTEDANKYRFYPQRRWKILGEGS